MLSNYFSKDHHEKFEKVHPYPDDDISPDQKANNPTFCLAHAKAFWSEYNRNECFLLWSYGTNQYDYTTLRLYMDGNQPVEKYKKQLSHTDPESNDGSRVMYESISWDNESVLPRFKESIMAILDKMDIEYSPKAVDEASISMKTRIKNMIWEQTQNTFYANIFKKIGIEFSPDLPFVPSNMTELEMYAKTALELSHEIKMRKVISGVFEDNDWSDEIKTKLYEDLYALAIAITRERIDPSTGNSIIEYVDPENCIFPKSKKHNYKDIGQVGEVKWRTVRDIRKDFERKGQPFDTAEFVKKIKSIINAPQQQFPPGSFDNQETFSNDQADSHGRMRYDYMKVPVLVYEFMSWNEDVITEKGDRRYFEPHGTKEKETSTSKTYKNGYEMWYQCEWIIGTDMMVNYGPRSWVTRDKEGHTKSSYSIYRLGNKSMVAAMIPIEDKIELMTKKYMLAWKKAAPAGFKVNWQKLKGMALQQGNKKLHPFEVLDIYTDTGVLMENDVQENIAGRQQTSQARSFELIPGGMGNILNEYITAFNHEMARLQTITGITDAMLGADPKPGQLNGTTQMALEGSINRLKPMFKAYSVLKKETTKKVLIDVLNYARFNPDGFKVTYQDYNDNTIEKVIIGAKESSARFGLRVEAIATDEMKQAIIQSAQSAVAKGTLQETDLITIVEQVSKGNIKFARQLLEYKTMKMMEIQAQTNRENMESNIQAQQQSAEANTEGKLREIQEKGKEERETLKLESEIMPRNLER